MDKLEEAASNYYWDELQNWNRYSEEEICTSMMVGFFKEQNTLTLDSKIKDGVDWQKVAKRCQDKIIKLEEQLACIDLMRSGELNWSKKLNHFIEQQEQIEQLAKERDEFKEAIKKPLEDLFDELQAEKQKVKERDEYIKLLSKWKDGYSDVEWQRRLELEKKLLNQ